MKRKNSLKHVLAFLLAVMMMLPMMSPISVYAAEEKELYLAHQNTEYGKAVVKLNDTDRLKYRVTDLCMEKGDKVDLCFINAGPIRRSAGWKSDNPSVATVDKAGVITAVSEGVATITYSYKNIIGAYKSAETKVYVGEDNWGISIGFIPSWGTAFSDSGTYGLKVGQDVPLYVCGFNRFLDIDSGAYSVAWKSSNPEVAELKGTVLTAKKPGTTKVTAVLIDDIVGTVCEMDAEFKVSEQVYNENEVAWKNEQYLVYGESYKKLFSGNMFFMTSHLEYEMLDAAMSIMRDQVGKIDLSAIASIADVTESLENSFNAMLNLKGYDYLTDKVHSEAVLYLLEEMSKEEDLLKTRYTQGVTDVVKKAKGLTSDIKEYSEFAKKTTELKEVLTNTSEKELKAIFGEMEKSAGKLGSILSEGITVAEYLTTTVLLYDLENHLLDDLQKCCDSGSTLFKDIEALKKERQQNPAVNFAQKYLSDKIAGMLAGAILDIAGTSTAGALKAAGKVVGILVDATGAGDLTDVAKTTIYMDYLTSVMDKIGSLQTEIRESYAYYSEQELMNKIEEYEIVYTTYLSMIYPVLQELQNLNGYNEELNNDSMIPKNGYDYAQHIAMVMSAYYLLNPDALHTEYVEQQETTPAIVIENGVMIDGFPGTGIVRTSTKSKVLYIRKDAGTQAARIDSKDVLAYGTKITLLDVKKSPTGEYWYKITADVDGKTVDGYVSSAYVEVEQKTTSEATDRLTVQEKMDLLLDKLGVGKGKTIYFTANQKAEENSVSNCSVSTIIQAEWFKDIFGTLSVKYFPDHDINGSSRGFSGKSCFGFACFAQWYIYADEATDNLDGERVAKTTFTKSNVQKYVQPGDVVRWYGKYDDETKMHSALVYAVTDTGIKVIDCNWDLECGVSLHEIPYTKWNGITIYVNRVTKTDELPEGMAGLYQVANSGAASEKSEQQSTYGTLDLSSRGWKAYNVGTTVEMYADKAYTIRSGAKLEILGKYTNSKGNEIYHVYSEDLDMKCYVAAWAVKLEQ